MACTSCNSEAGMSASIGFLDGRSRVVSKCVACNAIQTEMTESPAVVPSVAAPPAVAPAPRHVPARAQSLDDVVAVLRTRETELVGIIAAGEAAKTEADRIRSALAVLDPALPPMTAKGGTS